MAIRRISTDTLTDIADAIREKAGTTDTIKVKDMATAIATIPSGEGQLVRLSDGTIESDRSAITFTCDGKPKYAHLVYGMGRSSYYSSSSVIGVVYTLRDDGTYYKAYESHFNGSSQGIRYGNSITMSYDETNKTLTFTCNTTPSTYGFTPTTTYGKYMCWVEI